MKEQLAKIRAEALSAMEGADSRAQLDALRVQYLGKKGELTAVLKQMGRLSPEEQARNLEVQRQKLIDHLMNQKM